MAEEFNAYSFYLRLRNKANLEDWNHGLYEDAVNSFYTLNIDGYLAFILYEGSFRLEVNDDSGKCRNQKLATFVVKLPADISEIAEISILAIDKDNALWTVTYGEEGEQLSKIKLKKMHKDDVSVGLERGLYALKDIPKNLDFERTLDMLDIQLVLQSGSRPVLCPLKKSRR